MKAIFFQKDFFWHGFRRSAVLHLLVLIFALVWGITAPKSERVLLPSIRVDLVGLPEITKKEIVNLEDLKTRLDETQKKIEKPVFVPPEEMTIKKPPEHIKEKKDLKNAIDKIKALQSIEETVKKSTKPKSISVVKGNVVSKGNALSGESNVSISEYAEKVRVKLLENWDLPVWLSTQNLSAKVVIFLDKAGYVNNAVLMKNSGNNQFDDYVLKTIRRSEPFGTPPQEIQSDGMTLGFPL